MTECTEDGWTGDAWPMEKGDATLDAQFKHVGEGKNVVGVSYWLGGGVPDISDNLTKTPNELAAEIDAAAMLNTDGEADNPYQSQGPLPWDGASSEEETRWFGTTVRMTAIDRKMAERGLVREGEAILYNVVNGGKALAVKWPDMETPIRLTITDQYIVEVVKLVDSNAVDGLPDGLRISEGKKAKDAWYAGVKQGGTDTERIGLGMFDMIDKGLGFRGYKSVDEAFRVLIDTLAYGEWVGGFEFSDAINRIKSVASKVASNIQGIQPATPRRLPQTEEDFNRAGAAISDQIVELGKGAALGLQQIMSALFTVPDSDLSVAYEAVKKSLESARQEYFDLAAAAEKKSAELADEAAQSAYSKFDASGIKMPTAVQLGAKKIATNGATMIRLNDSGEGWTNGHLLDTGALPTFIKKVTDAVFGDTPLDTVKADHTARIIDSAKSNNIQVEPVANYNAEHADTSSTAAIKKGAKIQTNAVVLVNKEVGIAVTIDARYFAYFFKTYKGAEFFTSSDDRGSVAVKKAGQVVGVIMPIGSKSADVLKRAMKAITTQAVAPAVVEQTPAAKVDAAYPFASASTAFKEWLSESLDKAEYSPFATAKAMEDRGDGVVRVKFGDKRDNKSFDPPRKSASTGTQSSLQMFDNS